MQYHWKVGESKKSTDSSYEHHGRNHSLPMWLHLNIDITTTHHTSSLHLWVTTEAAAADAAQLWNSDAAVTGGHPLPSAHRSKFKHTIIAYHRRYRVIIVMNLFQDATEQRRNRGILLEQKQDWFNTSHTPPMIWLSVIWHCRTSQVYPLITKKTDQMASQQGTFCTRRSSWIYHLINTLGRAIPGDSLTESPQQFIQSSWSPTNDITHWCDHLKRKYRSSPYEVCITEESVALHFGHQGKA